MARKSIHLPSFTDIKKQVQLAAFKLSKLAVEGGNAKDLVNEKDKLLKSTKLKTSEDDPKDTDVALDEETVIDDPKVLCSADGCSGPDGIATNATIVSQTDKPAQESMSTQRSDVDRWGKTNDAHLGASGALLPLAASPMLLIAAGSLGAVALAGGNSIESGSPSKPDALVVSGQFAAGPVLDGTSVVVDIYRNGVLLKSSVPVNASGFYSYTIEDGKGGVIVARARDADGVDSPDYLSETGSNKNLSADLRAAAQATDGKALTLHINPLTELAVRKMAIVDNNISPTLDIAAINKAMAKLWGLKSDVDITQTAPELTIGLDGKARAGDAYGKVLALLAGLDEVNGGLELSLKNVDKHIGEKAGNWTSPNLIAQLADAVKKVSNLSMDVIPRSLTLLDQVAPFTVRAEASGLSSDGTPKSGTYVAGDLIQITLELSEFAEVIGTPLLPLTMGDHQVNASYIKSKGNSLVFEYQVQTGDQASSLQIASPLPNDWFSKIKDLNGNTLNNQLPEIVNGSIVKVDAVKPFAPKLNLMQDTGNGSDGSATDALTNNGNLRISGVEAGATWQYSTDGGASWTVGQGTNFLVTGDGAKSVITRQIDLAGNISEASAALNFLLDTTSPGAVTIDMLGNNIITVFHQINGYTLSGNADLGATVNVKWGNLNFTTTAQDNGQGQGKWSLFLSPQGIRAFTNASTTVSASVTDLAGNTTQANPQTLAISNSPLITAIHDRKASSNSDDGYINASELNHGITVSGYALPGKEVLVFIEGRDGFRMRATADATTGKWSVNFDNYTLPSAEDSALTTDAPLSSIFKVAMFDGSELSGSRKQIFDIGISSVWVSEINAQSFPSLTNSPVINNEVISSGGAQINGTIEAGATVTLYWDDNTTPIAPPISSHATSGQWSFLLAPSAFESLSFGEHVLKYLVTDIAGNTTVRTRTVMVANQLPTPPTIVNYANDAPINTVNLAAKNSQAITFTGSAPNADHVTVTWEGLAANSLTFSNGTWTATFNSAPADASNTVLTVNAFDPYNNISSSTQIIKVDTSIVVPTVNSVGTNNTLNHDQVHSNAGISLSGTAEPGAVLSIVWGNFNNNTVVAGSDGRWALTISKSDAVANINNSTGSLIVFQTDIANNTSSQTMVNVIVDITMPDAPLVTTMKGTGEDAMSNGLEVDIWNTGYVNQIVASHEVVISGTAEAGATINIVWGNTPAKTIVLGATQTNWTTTYLPSEIPLNTNSAGTGTTHVLQVSATDALGNRSAITSKNLVVDTEPPTSPTINMVGSAQTIQGVEYDFVNWNHAKNGITISGTGTKGAQLLVVWGESNPTTVTVDATTGVWSLFVNRTLIPGYHRSADNKSVNDAVNDTYSVSVLELDTAGNRSVAANHNVMVRWNTSAVTLEPTTSDGYINSAEFNAADGNNEAIALMGTAEVNASIRIQWGGMDKTVTADASGNWSYKLRQSDIPTSAFQTPMVLTATDVFGNVTSTSTQNGAPGGINIAPWVFLNTPTITNIQVDTASVNADTPSITFTVTFSDPILPDNVSAASFSAHNGVVENIQLVSGSNNKKYTVSVTPTDGQDSGSQIYLKVADNSLTDFAGNPVPTGSLAGQMSIPLDNVMPSIFSATDTISGAANQSHNAIDVTLSLSEHLQGTLNTSHFVASLGTVTQVVKLDDTQYTVRIAPNSNVSTGNISLQLLDNTGLKDQAGNALLGAEVNWTKALDNVAPTVSGVTNSVVAYANKATTKIDFIVTFNEALVGDVSPLNFSADHGVVTNVNKLDDLRYKVEVTPNEGLTGNNIGLHLLGSLLRDTAGNFVANANLVEKSNVFVDNVAPLRPQLTFNGLETYTPRAGVEPKPVDFIANSGSAFGFSDANHISRAEYSSGFVINGTAEANSEIELKWVYMLDGLQKSLTIEDDSITHNGNAWSYRFDAAHLPPTASASFSTLFIYASDMAGNTSDSWSQLVTLGYVI